LPGTPITARAGACNGRFWEAVGLGAPKPFSKSGVAKIGPSETSFCRICSPIAGLLGKKSGEKWAAAVDLQPAISKSDSLLG